MALKSIDLLEIPKVRDAETGYANLEAMLVSGGLTIYLVKRASEIGFSIHSKVASKIIADAGYETQKTQTTEYGIPPDEEPPDLHHDGDKRGYKTGLLEVVHHHRTEKGRSKGLFVPVIKPVKFQLAEYADVESLKFDDEIFGQPGYQEVIETDDELLFVGDGPGYFAHMFVSLPNINSMRTTALTFIDKVS